MQGKLPKRQNQFQQASVLSIAADCFTVFLMTILLVIAPIHRMCCGYGCFLLFAERQRLVGIRNVCVLLHNMTLTPQQESGGKQSLNSDRAPGMDSACTDTNFCSQTISVAVAEAGGGIVIHTCCIHLLQEPFCGLLVICRRYTPNRLSTVAA